MEALGIVASVIAVVHLSGKLSSLCWKSGPDAEVSSISVVSESHTQRMWELPQAVPCAGKVATAIAPEFA